MQVLVTGAQGFVGQALVRSLLHCDHVRVSAAIRRPDPAWELPVPLAFVGEMDSKACWSQSLSGIDVVIHAAARVHQSREWGEDVLRRFREVNVQGTLNLARQAAASGVRRLVFISSIKVNGECSGTRPFSPADRPCPTDYYAISKTEAEQALMTVAAQTGMEVVIIRPVLVYGPGVRANFHSMMRWLARRVPLPLGAINNKRSLVSLDNLVDFIRICMVHPAAANEVFLVSDGEDLSTPQILQRLGQAMGRPARLVPLPGVMLRVAARLLGKKHLAQRLCDSLQVDISKNDQLLGWQPPVAVDAALQKTADHYLEHQ